MPRYSSEAYDFSLFEERPSTEERVSNARWDNAQPEEQPREEPRKRPQENVVELPEEELKRTASHGGTSCGGLRRCCALGLSSRQ